MPTLTHIIDSPVGKLACQISLETSGAVVSGLWFFDRLQQATQDEWGHAGDADHPLLTTMTTQLAEYFAGQRQDFDLPTAFTHGTEHQRKIWELITQVHYGHTATYGQLAAAAGIPAGAQAVGQAVGRNPISIIVGCHRIVGSRGVSDLTGYGGGLDRKRFLLDLEGILPAQGVLL